MDSDYRYRRSRVEREVVHIDDRSHSLKGDASSRGSAVPVVASAGSGLSAGGKYSGINLL